MERRTAIRCIAAASVGTVFLTGCTEKNVVELVTNGRLQLDPKHLDYLTAISEAFLPVSDLTGKIEPPAAFIMAMINDMRPQEAVMQFAEGFEKYKLLMKNVGNKILQAEAKDIISTVEQTLTDDPPDDILVGFINDVKELSVYHFTTSEYFLVNHREYQMIPPPYKGCVTI